MNSKNFFEVNGYLPKVFVTPPGYYTPAFNAMIDHYGSNREKLARVVWQGKVPFIEELKKNANIRHMMRELIGPARVYSVSIFNKYPGTAFVDWHQDAPYWQDWEKKKKEVVTAWYAVDDSSLENGCLKVIPGTHLRILPHMREVKEGNMLPQNLTVSGIDVSTAVPLILRSGEASFHHGLIVHGSDANKSTARRSGIAIRYISFSLWDRVRMYQKNILKILRLR